MPFRTKSELATIIDDMFPDNDEGEISEADMRSALDDINDSFARAATANHNRYAAWTLLTTLWPPRT